MYPYLHELLSDRKGGAVFACFGLWHFFWMALTAAVCVVLYRFLAKRNAPDRSRWLDRLTGLAFGLYILDFFLMPLAYGEIDIEKLPFHACTAMCVCVFISRRSTALARLRGAFALLGLVSNLVYLIYPAGVMWHAVHPVSYRVIQTLGFHGLVTAVCLMALLFEDLGGWKRTLSVTAAMTAWAMVGNAVYNSEDRVYNWFFVVGDPFGILPAQVAPFVMPALNICLFFAVGMALSALLRRLRGANHAL